MAVDDQPKISFSAAQRTLLWQPIFVDFMIHKTDFGHASGTAGRLNVGLCRASSYLIVLVYLGSPGLNQGAAGLV